MPEHEIPQPKEGSLNQTGPPAPPQPAPAAEGPASSTPASGAPAPEAAAARPAPATEASAGPGDAAAATVTAPASPRGTAAGAGQPPAGPRPPGSKHLAALPVGRPPFRRLRAYAFDPSLSTQLDSAAINQVTLKVPWEFDPKTGADCLLPGPVGRYLEVVDFDPASGCFYAPVDLSDPHLLARDGISPSEGNPYFHQQMTYAVAMITIRNFERALGRSALWAPQRWMETDAAGAVSYHEEQVERLRIYPHAMREANAYYSPEKKALLFGYFPAPNQDPREHLPGGIVFSCLSHDIVAHETTHALLDGLHPRFLEATNSDVLAFHEAFADVVALFQHFSFPEVLRSQIARTRGDLGTESLLGQLAQEFGRASGARGALRDALGGFDPQTGRWQPSAPDPTLLRSVSEPHARGSILVSALFRSFLAIYRARTADLWRIATGGTGLPPAGALPPDLVDRLAGEAAKSAQHILNMSIRALDYCPPVDLTFGDFLRALITADYDLVRDDDLGYRLAVVESFRQHGIYPLDVRSLSVDSLRWEEYSDHDYQPGFISFIGTYRSEIRKWGLAGDRRQLSERLRRVRAKLHHDLANRQDGGTELLRGLSLRGNATKFEIHSLRPARRVGPDGELLVDLVVEITQRRPAYFDTDVQQAVDSGSTNPPPPPDFWFRGGATLIVDLENLRLRYHIYKDLGSDRRLGRQRAFLGDGGDATLRALYFSGAGGRGGAAAHEPFAFLHRSAGEVW